MSTATRQHNRPPTPLLEIALSAAARGWHVFPLWPGAKTPALHGQDNCPRTGDCAQQHRGWEERATIDPNRVRTAWTRREYNVGIACGPSGLVVIDLDAPKPGDAPPPDWVLTTPGVRDGQDVLAMLADQTGQPLPAETYTVSTPSGGLHLYYQQPAETSLRNTSGDRGRGLGWKIDTRAHGGYVVAGGSVVPGGIYRVLHDQDPAPLPDWLCQRLTPVPLPAAPAVPIRPARGPRGRYLAAAIDGETHKVTTAKANRNIALYQGAVALGQLVAGGALTEAEVATELLSAAAGHIAVGAFSRHQAEQTIASGLRAGANRPRQIAA
ncbi:bifunctional DNA primase/polymerase [Pseudonocardia sp. Cha107L01]|uniref:bifunctional DNA primase/polymerase n=1 Tax=Pseudonocardia sp. Cha107L01 TaxID=3457576 RepID=UPI00403E4F27